MVLILVELQVVFRALDEKFPDVRRAAAKGFVHQIHQRRGAADRRADEHAAQENQHDDEDALEPFHAKQLRVEG